MYEVMKPLCDSGESSMSSESAVETEIVHSPVVGLPHEDHDLP